MSITQHLTTRRGFVGALGFGGVSLYGLWVGYGAAPGPLALLLPPVADDMSMTGDDIAMAGHGPDTSGPDIEAFRNTVAEFVDRYAQPDGIVYPQRDSAAAMDMNADAMAMNMAEGAEAMDMTAGATAMDHGQHGGNTANPETASLDDHAEPVDIPMLAERWFYEPAHLRLDAGTPYRFRLMATDIPHGASVQFGRGSRMIRLRAGGVSEVVLTFDLPGNYLVYCTTYCGAGHDVMQARIEVI